jgi:hypothetical protein
MLIKKVITFSAPLPIKKVPQGLPDGGMCSLLFRGFERGAVGPLITKEILDM